MPDVFRTRQAKENSMRLQMFISWRPDRRIASASSEDTTTLVPIGPNFEPSSPLQSAAVHHSR